MSAPLWRQAFDAVDRRIAGPVEGAVKTDTFSDAVAIGVRLQRRAQKEIERRTRRVLHLVNVPAATDVKRVSEQIAALQRQVRALQRELEAAQLGADGGNSPTTRKRSARAR